MWGVRAAACSDWLAMCFCVCGARETQDSQTCTDALKVLASAIGFVGKSPPPLPLLCLSAFSSFPHSFSIRELTTPP